MPSGGLPGKGRDADGDEGTFLAQTCTGRGHLGRGRFPSSKMNTTSHTCLCQKCTLIAVHVPALPGQPSTGHSLVPALGNSIRYVVGSPPPPPVAASVQLHLSDLAFPCCTIRCVSRDPAAIPFPHFSHSTRSFFLSQYVGPSPVILRPYATSD